jgi:hypothetical protein
MYQNYASHYLYMTHSCTISDNEWHRHLQYPVSDNLYCAIPGYDAVWSGRWAPTCQWNTLPKSRCHKGDGHNMNLNRTKKSSIDSFILFDDSKLNWFLKKHAQHFTFFRLLLLSPYTSLSFSSFYSFFSPPSLSLSLPTVYISFLPCSLCSFIISLFLFGASFHFRIETRSNGGQ